MAFYLCRGFSLNLTSNFRLGAEITEAGKFDDIVIEYSDNSKNMKYILVQSKHTIKEERNINIKELLLDDDGDFGFYKYYDSYQKSQQSDLFKNKIQYLIMHTNKIFNMTRRNLKIRDKWKIEKIADIVEKIVPKKDDALKWCQIGNCKFYNFKIETMRPILKDIVIEYEFKIIAKKLIDCLFNKQNISEKDSEFQNCYYLLTKEVIDMSTKKFRKEFIQGTQSDSEELQKFRHVLESLLNMKDKNLEEINNDPKIKFHFTEDFEKLIDTNKQIFDNQSWPVIPVIKDEDINNFLEIYVFTIDQPSEKEIVTYIEKELTKHFDNAKILDHLLAKMQELTVGKSFVASDPNLINPSDSRFMKSEKAIEFFTMIDRKNNEFIYKGPIMEYEVKMKDNFIYYDDDRMVKQLKNFSESNNKVLHVSSQYETLATIQICNSIKKINENFVFDRLRSMTNTKIHNTIKAFERKICNYSLFIIECDLDEINESIGEKIIEILKNNLKKQIILIAKHNHQFTEKFKKEFSSKSQFMLVEDIHFSIKPQKQYLEKILLKFQDHDINFNKVIKEGSDLLKDEALLTELINNDENIKLGKLNKHSKNIEKYYINRKFFIELKVDKYIIVLISEFKEEYFYKLLKITDKQENEDIISKSEELFFRQICKKYEGKKICLLRQQNDETVLLKKSKNFQIFFDELRSKIKNTLDNKVVILTAPPGMGKSSVFANLAQKIKESDPSLWVYKINLISLQETLNDIKNKSTIKDSEKNFENEKQNLIAFLECALELNGELEKKVFKEYLEESKIVLMFDGIDEISPKFEDVVIKIVKTFKNISKPKQLFVSTRPRKTILEDINDTLDCELQPFSNEDQKEFFENFWKTTTSDFDDNYFRKFVDVLLRNFNNTIIENDGKFLGIALHTMMIATTFKETFHDFCISKSNEISDELIQKIQNLLKLSTLFKEFVRVKIFDVLAGDKNNTIMSNINQDVWDEYFENLIEKLQLLSLNSLFEYDKFKSLLTENDLKKLNEIKTKFEKDGEKSGIVQQINEGTPIFIHKTFAEYFLANFIIDAFIKNNEQTERVEYFFLYDILQGEHIVICHFINELLSDEIREKLKKREIKHIIETLDGDILYIAIKNKWENIVKILIENDVDMNYTDHSGNSIFHLESVTENGILESIIKKFKNEPALLKNLIQSKNQNGETPFLEAIKTRKKTIVEIWIEKLYQLDILKDGMNAENNEGYTVLHCAVRNEKNPILQLVLKTFEDIKIDPEIFKTIIRKKSNNGKTPLLEAATRDNFDNFKILFEKLRQINILEEEFFLEDNWSNNILHLGLLSRNNFILQHVLNELNKYGEVTKTMFRNKNIEGETPLLFAVRLRCNNLDNVKLLIETLEKLEILEDELKVEENCRNNVLLLTKGQEKSHVFDFILKTLMKYNEIFQVLIRKRNDRGESPLLLAAKWDSLENIKIIVKILRQMNILKDEIFLEDNYGYNILLCAVTSENNGILHFVLDTLTEYPEIFDMIIRKKHSSGKNSLLFAAQWSNLENVRTLIEKLSELNILQEEIFVEDDGLNNILHCAIENKNKHVFEFILNTLIVKYHKVLEVKTIIRKKNIKGKSPLLLAVQLSNFGNMKILLKTLDELNVLKEEILVEDNYLNNILLRGFENPNVHVFQLLIDTLMEYPESFNMLVQKKNKKGESAITVAQTCGGFETVKILIEKLNQWNILENEVDI